MAAKIYTLFYVRDDAPPALSRKLEKKGFKWNAKAKRWWRDGEFEDFTYESAQGKKAIRTLFVVCPPETILAAAEERGLRVHHQRTLHSDDWDGTELAKYRDYFHWWLQ